MSEKFKVRLYADSLGLPRIGKVTVNERYIELLLRYWEEHHAEGVSCLDRARCNYTIVDLYSWFSEDNKYFGKEGDVMILQEGVVDCAPRPLPRKIRTVISKSPRLLRRIIVKFIHKNRATLQNYGFKFTLTKPDDFYLHYFNWLNEIKEVFNRIYIINIAPTNENIEKHSPGFTENVSKYNKLIAKAIANVNSDKIKLIDIHSLILNSEHSLDDLILPEDGHHITALGHSLYANKIIELEHNFELP